MVTLEFSRAGEHNVRANALVAGFKPLTDQRFIATGGFHSFEGALSHLMWLLLSQKKNGQQNSSLICNTLRGMCSHFLFQVADLCVKYRLQDLDTSYLPGMQNSLDIIYRQ